MIVDPAVIRASAARGDTRYPYAAWMPIPEAATQPHILPRLLILHSQAAPALTTLENLRAYVARDDVHIEPTFILDLDGRMAQLVDIFTRADCSAKANPFATSVETQDRGAAELATTPWSDAQVEQLAGLAAWMHLHPSIMLPLTTVTKWDGSGVGPHRQFPEWSVYVGKAVSLWTMIPTPDGFKTMHDVSVGDRVFDHLGQPTTVTAVYDRDPDQCYLITFSDGTQVRADAEHNWVALTTETIANHMHGRGASPSSPTRKSKTALHDYPDGWPTWEPVRVTDELEPGMIVPAARTLNLPDVDLQLDPYLLGVWLGDGTSVRGDVTARLGDDYAHVRQAFTEAGFAIGAEVVRNNTGTMKVVGLHAHLRELNVKANKHVPAQYLWGSADQRLALLQGLMDTDGTVTPRGQCSFDNTNERLADAVVWLCSSLGIVARKSKRRAILNGTDHGPSFRIHFTTSLPVFRLRRKIDRLQAQTMRRTKHRTIISIEPVPTEPMRCITVDSPHSMYLVTEACIPTHNTCPGNTRVAQVPLVISRAQTLATTPLPPPVSEEDDMPAPAPQLIRFRGYANELLFACNTFTHGTAEQIADWRDQYGTADRKAFVWEPHEQAMKGAFVKAGLSVAADAVRTPDGK